MKKKYSLPIIRNRILLSILLPVLAIGLIIASVSIYYLTPPLFSLIQDRIDSELKLASKMGLQICENNLNYLMELRLENNPEMNAALRKEAVEQVKGAEELGSCDFIEHLVDQRKWIRITFSDRIQLPIVDTEAP